jgi:hypothetical protein
VPDEAALRAACARLDAAGVRYAAFHEPDRGGELTAVASEPVCGARRAPFRRFRLLQAPEDSARPLPYLEQPVMNTNSTNAIKVFRTRFNWYVPCDRQTYRKLKRIRHLVGFAEAERARWNRSQRRQPHNRVFKRRRGDKVVREPADASRMVFAPLFELRPAPPAMGLPPDALLAAGTELLTLFYADYLSARHPVPDASAVKPPRLTAMQIDELLERIELWNLRR